MTTFAVLRAFVVKGSTAELKRAGETLCAFLNGEGGQVQIGVVPDGIVARQFAIEVRGRDTNRVIEVFRTYGIADEAAWFSQKTLAELFGVGVPAVVPGN